MVHQPFWIVRPALLLATAASIAACGTTEINEPAPSPGVVTLRFVNPTGADIYVDETYGSTYEVRQGGTVFNGPYDCTSDCSSCECLVCGPAQPIVLRIQAGSHADYVWEGDYYELRQCGDGCSCEAKHVAERGAYDVTLGGAMGYIGESMPLPNDPNRFPGDLDPAAGQCTAAGAVTLDGSTQTVEIPFACPP